MMSSSLRLVSIGNYKVHKANSCLGKGSFARVEKARHALLKVDVALKVICCNKAKDNYVQKHMTREAQILMKLQNHENIVKLFEVCRSERVLVLVLEIVEDGLNLGQRLDQLGGLMGEDEAAQIGLQVGKALDYMHGEGVLHRDLKLDNIMVNTNTQKVRFVPAYLQHNYCKRDLHLSGLDI